MIRLYLILIISFSLLSCSNQIVGYYEHNICCYGPNCFKLRLNENKTFEYEYHQDILGSGFIYGNYNIKFNKVILNPILPYEYHLQSPFIEYDTVSNINSTRIKFYELSPVYTKVRKDLYKELELENYELEKFDTTFINDCIFMVNGKLHVTDSTGISYTKISRNDIIEINSFFSNEPIFRYIVESDNIKELRIYYNSTISNPQIFDWIVKEYKIKKDGLHPLSFEPEMVFLGDYSYFNRDKCLATETFSNIRDSIFYYISNNIDWKIAGEELCDDGYLIYFNRFGKIRKVVYEPLGDSKFEDFAYNFIERKCRRKIKKSLKKIRFDRKEFGYNYRKPIFIELFYDNDSNTLEY